MASQPEDSQVVSLQDTPHLPQPVSTGEVPPLSDMRWQEGISPALDPAQIQMGGAPLPSVEELQAMHDADYILRAAKGSLRRLTAEKVRLPPDPGSVQSIGMARAPDGTVYAIRDESIIRSADAGRTWTAQPQGRGPQGYVMPAGAFTVLDDGTFIGLGRERRDQQDPMPILVSGDEGRSWETRATVEIPREYRPYVGAYGEVTFLAGDGTLLCPVDVRRAVDDPEHASWHGSLWSGLCFRSADDGHTWECPSLVCHWWAGAEGGMAQTPSGKIVAAVRYQRPLLPWDPPDLVERNRGYTTEEDGRTVGYPYKTVFMADTCDSGRTWQDFRQVCTRFGQTRGYPAALSDGTLVVAHDTRYGPGGPGTRALVSRDEGMTWQDQVYYLDYSFAPGSYNASVVLEGDLMLTIVCTTRPGQDHWGPAETTAIRWRLDAD